MIQVFLYASNMERKTIVVQGDRSLRSVLEENNIDYMTGGVHLDGVPLGPGDIDKTFADFGICEKCFLTRIVKGDGA